ncbi:MAG: nicotinate-nucleotide adenylyltransferase [Desulfobacteraceae bacterium]|nr:MAG: nicotinate-nucleotide adenylyltransferase [Desulfobacteraceae bacterium]
MKYRGLFGGTFNPVHFGHLRSAYEVQTKFSLDSVCFIPAAIPPHKQPSSVADAKDRFEMIRMAVSDYPKFCVSDVELRRSGPSYTIDTVKHFKANRAEPVLFYLIVGLDAFLEINTWKSFKELFSLVPFIVMTRPGLNCQDSGDKPDVLYDFLNSEISVGYSFSSQDSCYIHDTNQPVYVFEVSRMDISSTKIRELTGKGESVCFLTPAKVELFIKNRGLYR